MNDGMKIWKCLKYDIRAGIFSFAPFYVFAMFFFGLFAHASQIKLGTMGAPGVADLSVEVFRGMEEYVYVKGGPPFDIPIEYLVMGFITALFACYYPRREWKVRGAVYIPRYQSKYVWWFSKCIWCVMQMVLLYLLIFLVYWGIAALGGNGAIHWAADGKKLAYVYLLGVVTATALNQLQLTLQMIVSPALSYSVVIGILTSSAFFFRPYMIGNCYMMLRMKLMREDGITLGQGLGYSLLVWGISLLAGIVVVRRKDIL